MSSGSKNDQAHFDSNDQKILPINKTTLIFIIVILVALVSRFYDLESRAMSHDESLHTYYSWLLTENGNYSHNAMMHGPFQFHMVAGAFAIFGDNDFTARIPAVLFSVAAIAFLWKYKEYLGKTGAMVTAVLFTISPYLMYYGRYVRNEAFVMFLSVVSVWAVWKYLDKGENKYLYVLSAMTAIHFATKETSFIFTAQILIFLGILFLFDVIKIPWKSKKLQQAFYIALAAAFFFLIITFYLKGFTLADGTMPAPINLLGLSLQGFMLPLIIVVISIAAALASLFKGLDTNLLKRVRSFEIIILTITLILPLLVALPVSMAGWDPLDLSTMVEKVIFGTPYTIPQYFVWVAAIVIPFFIISIVFGLWWNKKQWIINALIFYGIFAVLYTTVFTNGTGFLSGLVSSLGYWLKQQEVARGGQPWYYYILVQIPIYEYLAATGVLFALGFAVNKIKIFQKNETLEESPEIDYTLSTIKGENLGVIFLIFWTFTSLFAYTVAGERMPWLTVHIAIPMLMLTGWAIGIIIDRINWRELKNKQGLLFVAMLPILAISLQRLFKSLSSEIKPFQGNSLVQMGITNNFIFSFLTFAAASFVINYIIKKYEWKRIELFDTLFISLFTALALLTTRTAIMANYQNYDMATEFLVYAHSAPGVKEVIRQIEEISYELTDGLNIEVGFDSDVSWPMSWYFRNYPNQKFYGTNPTSTLRSAPIIVAGRETYGKIQPIVSSGYYEFEYIRMWWPIEDYRDLTLQKIYQYLTTTEIRAGLFDIWLNRDYDQYWQAVGKSNTISTWSPSDPMRLYIRKDVAAMIWEYGVNAESEPVFQDLYTESMLDIFPDSQLEFDLSGPRGLAVAPDGRLYLADSNNHRILVIEDNEIVNEWGFYSTNSAGQTAEDGGFSEPWGVAVSPDGEFVYVTDTWNHRIQKFTSEGEHIDTWSTLKTEEAIKTFWGPRDITVDQDGNVYFSDTGNKRIVVVDQNGKYITEIGAAGIFDEPVGLAIDPTTGKLFIADTWNQKIQVYDRTLSGDFISADSWTIDGWYGQSMLNKPFISVNHDGLVFVSDPENSRVIVFTTDGEYKYSFGNSTGHQIGFPIGVGADKDGIWVSDDLNNRLLHYPNISE